MRKEFSRAVERYRVASDTLSADGSVPVARLAIEESEQRLAVVGAAAGVSLAQPARDAGPGSFGTEPAARPSGGGSAGDDR
jgi:hypothetical protein